MKTCLLCDAPANSREHYIPGWLSSACNAKEIEMARGEALRREIVRKQIMGPLANASTRILCINCNTKLGQNLEEPARVLLSPVIAKDFQAQSTDLKADELLIFWMILRALEFGIVLKRRIDQRSIGEQCLEMCRHGRDGVVPSLWKWFVPTLEAFKLKEKTVSATLSQSFYSYERGEVKSEKGFWFLLQMNHLALFLIHAPDAQRNNSKGYGLSRLLKKAVF